MFTYELWDKKSPINGVPAENMLQGVRGSVVLIRGEEGHVNVFQYGIPDPFNDTEALEWGKNKCEEMNNPPEPPEAAESLEERLAKLETATLANSLMSASLLGIEVDMPDEKQEELILSAFDGVRIDRAGLARSIKSKSAARVI